MQSLIVEFVPGDVVKHTDSEHTMRVACVEYYRDGPMYRLEWWINSEVRCGVFQSADLEAIQEQA